MKLGTTDIKNMFLGTTEVKKIFSGNKPSVAINI